MDEAFTRRDIIPAGMEGHSRDIAAHAARYPDMDMFTFDADEVVDVDPAASTAALGAYQQIIASGY